MRACRGRNRPGCPGRCSGDEITSVLQQDPWTLPILYDVSLLDVPETPEARERIEWLKQQIAELKRQQQEQEGSTIKEVTSDVAREVQSLLPEEPSLEEQPSETERA